MNQSESPITVIIADDEFAIRSGLQKIVNIEQYNVNIVAVADNGKDALALIKEHQPDLAIIDVNMPQMDGLEVIRHSVENKFKTRFFILSGFGDFSYAQTAICYGVKYYFLKPLNIADFRKQFIKQCEEVYSRRYGSHELFENNISTVMSSSRIMFLNQLVQNKIYNFDAMVFRLSELYLSLSNSSCCCVIFRFSDTTSISLTQLCDTYIQDAFGNIPVESWVYDETQILSLFNLTDDLDPEFRTLITQCASHLQDATSSKIMLGIGSVVPSLNYCHDSFIKAQEALSYHIYRQNSCVFDSHIISQKTPTFSKENIDVAPLVNYILRGNITAIREYCGLFYHSLFFVQMPPPNFLFGMSIYLVMQVQKQLTLTYPDKKFRFDTNIEEISAFQEAQNLSNWLIDTFIQYSDMVRVIHEDSNKLISTAKEYINNNLHRNLKVKEVATQINLSESYFAIYFKEKTGINFRDYILKARIEHAKKLLLTKKTSISEIAYLTGYQDYRSFSRAFKNETGVSPSDYVNAQ